MNGCIESAYTLSAYTGLPVFLIMFIGITITSLCLSVTAVFIYDLINPPKPKKKPPEKKCTLPYLNYTACRYNRKILFKFLYVYRQNTWRSYILSDIPYEGKSSNLFLTHRHFDMSARRYYICWSAPVRFLDDMVEISKMWADKTVEYIHTGRKF